MNQDGRVAWNSPQTPWSAAIETFILCDLSRYELSASGSMCGTEANSIVYSILNLPPGAAVRIDLVDVSVIDDAAATALANAVRHQHGRGVELSILGSEEVEEALHAAGLAIRVVRRPGA